MSESESPEREASSEVQERALSAALAAATTPIAVNRFDVLPGPFGLDGQHILVLGTFLAGQFNIDENDVPFSEIRMHGAYLLTREAAADLAVRLPHIIDLSPDELEAAAERQGISR